MRFNSILLFFGFMIITDLVLGQDVIYKIDGSKFSGQVTEITPEELKYKSAENPTGPTYVVSIQTILLIEYKNGTIEYVTKDPKTVVPGKDGEDPDKGKNKPSSKIKKPENDLLYLNKNTLLLNGAALANADITFLYDREFLNGHLSANALAGYNFNPHVTWPNSFVRQLAHTKKNYDLGFGINLYPITGTKVQYYLGMLFKYMNYSYDKEVPVYQTINGNVYKTGIEYQKTTDYQFSTLLVNGIQVRITPTFNYKIFLGLGGFNAKGELYDKLNDNGGSSSSNGSSTGSSIRTFPKMYIGTCFGFRF